MHRPTSPMKPQLTGERSSRRASSMGPDSVRPDGWMSQFYFVNQANVKNAHAATSTAGAIIQITAAPLFPTRLPLTIRP